MNLRIVVLPLALAALACSHTKAKSGRAEMLALVKPILSCKYKKDSMRLPGGEYFFVSFSKCKAFDDFRYSRNPYFDTEPADQALVHMLTGSDEKLAAIAASRKLHDPRKVLADKARVERLLATAGRPNNLASVRRVAITWLSYADFHKLGLTARLEALARSPHALVRASVGRHIIAERGLSSWPSRDTEIDLVGSLLRDNEPEVVKAAAKGLSSLVGNGAIRAVRGPWFNKGCGLLKQAVERADDKTDYLLEAAAGTPCPGLPSAVIHYLDEKTSDPTKITGALGPDWASAVGWACGSLDSQAILDHGARSRVRAEKKKGFAVALRMTSAKDPDPDTRKRAIPALAECDQKGAKAAMRVVLELTKDKVRDVSETAKRFQRYQESGRVGFFTIDRHAPRRRP